MKIKENKFYVGITGISALIVAAVSFLAVILLPSVDNPSSTAGLAIFFAIIYTFMAGGFGLLTGLFLIEIVDLMARKTRLIKNPGFVKAIGTFVLVAGFISIAGILYGITWQKNKAHNAKNTIEVKYDSGVIVKQSVPVNEISRYNLELNREHAIGYIGGVRYDVKKDFIWNGKKYLITFDRDTNHILVKNEDQSVFIDHSLEGYNYIIGVTFANLENENGSFLLILSRLRATSSMSVLDVFNAEGKMIYEELMDRNNILETGEVNGQKVMVIGNKDIRANDTLISVRDFVYGIKAGN